MAYEDDEPSIQAFICTGLARKSHADKLIQYCQDWVAQFHEIKVTELTDYADHNVETLMYMKALRWMEKNAPDDFVMIMTDRVKLTSYAKAKLSDKLIRQLCWDSDINYLSLNGNDKDHDVMIISPRGRGKILGNVGLPDGRLVHLDKNLNRQLHLECDNLNISANYVRQCFFILDPANSSIDRSYENYDKDDPIVILPQFVPPPQFRISGLVWFIFIVMIVLLLAWALIKIGPGGHKTTKTDEELAQERHIPLRGETEFFEPVPIFDQFSPYPPI